MPNIAHTFDARTASIVGDIVVECAIVLSFYLSHTSARTHTHASARAHTYKRAIVRPAAADAFGGGGGGEWGVTAASGQEFAANVTRHLMYLTS